MNHERKEPTTLFAVVSFLVIIAVLIIMINMGCNTTLSVFSGVIVSVITTRLLNIPWNEVERNIIKTAAECMPTFLIVIMVGMLVGIWMAGGTVPTLMYYGMQVVSPKILVPLAFVLCALTSEFTGTSFGSVATMGLAMVGIASTTSIPVPLVHAPGGVCPFGIKDGIKVYLDESLKRFETVYPAAGNDHSAVRLTIAELEDVAGACGWIDVCKEM